MLTKTPCKHPVIFLKDVSAQQMAILLKYMYLGQISVKKEVSAGIEIYHRYTASVSLQGQGFL